MGDNAQLAETKKNVRKQCMRKRRQWAAHVDRELYIRVANIFLDTFDVRGKIVSGFLPIGSEIDVRPLLHMCRKRQATICLPCVVGESMPLLFRQWQEGDILLKERFGTLAPTATAEQCIPDIVLVPMLAFDSLGNRLGYGGGFFDRTLENLKKQETAQKSLVTVGIAFEQQKIPAVPAGEFDMPLDCVITEDRCYTF